MDTPTLDQTGLAGQLDLDGLLPPPPRDVTEKEERARAEQALALLTRAAAAQRITLIGLPAALVSSTAPGAPLFGAAFVVDTKSKEKTLLFDESAPLARRLWSIAHEIGHATLGHRYKKMSKGEADREADTIADQICQRFTLPTVQAIALRRGARAIRRPARPIADAVTRLLRSGR